MSLMDDNTLYTILREHGMLREEPWDKSCPNGNRCNHVSAAACKQARLVFDHKQRCAKKPCDCFSSSRGIPSSARVW